MWHFCWAQKYTSSSFWETADNYLHSLCLEERICKGADASCRGISWENTCPACWGPQSSWPDADHARKHLKPRPSAAIIQSESSSSAADWPQMTKEVAWTPDCKSYSMTGFQCVSLQIWQCKAIIKNVNAPILFSLSWRRKCYLSLNSVLRVLPISPYCLRPYSKLHMLKS